MVQRFSRMTMDSRGAFSIIIASTRVVNGNSRETPSKPATHDTIEIQQAICLVCVRELSEDLCHFPWSAAHDLDLKQKSTSRLPSSRPKRLGASAMKERKASTRSHEYVEDNCVSSRTSRAGCVFALARDIVGRYVPGKQWHRAQHVSNWINFHACMSTV
jgi:hypothetical protein